MDSLKTPQLVTSGVIAAEVGATVTSVQYVLATRGHIRPAARAGRTRLYGRDAVAKVRHELNSIAARQGGHDE